MGNFAVLLKTMSSMTPEAVRELSRSIDWQEPCILVCDWETADGGFGSRRGFETRSWPVAELLRHGDRRLIDELLRPELLGSRRFLDADRGTDSGWWDGAFKEAFFLGDRPSALRMLSFPKEVFSASELVSMDFSSDRSTVFQRLASNRGIDPNRASEMVELAIDLLTEKKLWRFFAPSGRTKKEKIDFLRQHVLDEWLLLAASALNPVLSSVLLAKGASVTPKVIGSVLSEPTDPTLQVVLSGWRALSEQERAGRLSPASAKEQKPAASESLALIAGKRLAQKLESSSSSARWPAKSKEEKLRVEESWRLCRDKVSETLAELVRSGLLVPGGNPEEAAQLAEGLAPWAGLLGKDALAEICRAVPSPSPRELVLAWTGRDGGQWFGRRASSASERWSDKDRAEFGGLIESSFATSMRQPSPDSLVSAILSKADAVERAASLADLKGLLPHSRPFGRYLIERFGQMEDFSRLENVLCSDQSPIPSGSPARKPRRGL